MGLRQVKGNKKQKKGAVQKVQLEVVELVETTIFSVAVITYWTAPILFND